MRILSTLWPRTKIVSFDTSKLSTSSTLMINCRGWKISLGIPSRSRTLERKLWEAATLLTTLSRTRISKSTTTCLQSKDLLLLQKMRFQRRKLRQLVCEIITSLIIDTLSCMERRFKSIEKLRDLTLRRSTGKLTILTQ